MSLELFSLKGKTALITGATGSLGSDFARAFAAAGADLVLVSRTEESLAALAKEINERGGRAEYLACDLTDRGQVTALPVRAWTAFGRIDTVLHNAIPRLTNTGSLIETPDEIWQQEFDVVLWACLQLCRGLVPRMIEAGGGSITTVVSSTGINPTPGYAAYGMAKGALLLLTKYMAKEWGAHGIRANSLNPGVIAHPGQEEEMQEMSRRTGVFERISMRRVGRQQEVVGTAVFLASDAASYISGQLINIDGGRL